MLILGWVIFVVVIWVYFGWFMMFECVVFMLLCLAWLLCFSDGLFVFSCVLALSFDVYFG